MKIYNMDIGFGQPISWNTPEQQAVLDGIYAMMDPDRGARLQFDVILSDLEYDGAETVSVFCATIHRPTGQQFNAERVSFTLKELFS